MFGLLPPSSSVTFLIVPAASSMIRRPVAVSPVKATLSTSGLRDQHLANLAARPGDHVDDAIRNASIAANLAEDNRGQRRGRRRLENQRIAGRKCWRQLPGCHQQREVPGHDLRANADRLPQGVVEQRTVHRDLLAPELGREVAVVLEAVCRGGHIGARLHDDLAAIHRLKCRDLVDSVPQDLRDAVQRTRPLQRRPARPGPLVECLPGGLDRSFSVLEFASGTRPIGWFVVGLTVSKVLPLRPGTDLPSISSEYVLRVSGAVVATSDSIKSKSVFGWKDTPLRERLSVTISSDRQPGWRNGRRSGLKIRRGNP